MAQTDSMKLRLLGTVTLEGAAGAAELLAQSKLVALLAYLAVAGGHQRRDRIVGLLWPELDQTHARGALRKSLHALRRLLGSGAVATRGDDDVAVAPEALWCDAAEFTAAADGGRLARALELYKGELMPGFHVTGCAEYARWLDDERAAARDRAAAAAWAMAQQHEQNRRNTHAGEMARRAVRFEWGNERVLRRALEMLERLGDNAGALKLYDDFAKRLREDLDAEPSAETLRLVERLRGRAGRANPPS
jgi:serine/threonine-protein kinase